MELKKDSHHQQDLSKPLLLVTGASGFLGQYVVAEALRHGYRVRATTRSQPKPNHHGLEWFQCDLQDLDSIKQALEEVGAVIHLAAAKTGSYQQQWLGTVTSTENLLTAMAQTQTKRLIGISSFSVFDYTSLSPGDTLDEDSPIEKNPQHRDNYAQMKLLQEEKMRGFEQTQGGKVTILRPGMIYGRDHWWNARLGITVKDKLWLNIGDRGIMPLIYVENCAQAIMASVESSAAIGKTLNLVDDNLPTQQQYCQGISQHLKQSPPQIFLNRYLINLVTNIVWQINQKLFRGKIKLPGLFIPARFDARFKPLKYCNQRAQKLLNWTPLYSLEQAIERGFSSQDLLSVEGVK